MKQLMIMSAAVVALLLFRPGFAHADAGKVTGEIIDTYCYMTMGATGESHRACGIGCAKKGIPVAILEKGTDKVYVLLPNKNETSLPDDVINKMGRTATVTGQVYSKGGSQFLTVQSIS